jgi:hypothetical protein
MKKEIYPQAVGESSLGKATNNIGLSTRNFQFILVGLQGNLDQVQNLKYSTH